MIDMGNCLTLSLPRIKTEETEISENFLARKELAFNDKRVSSSKDIQLAKSNLEKLETMIQKSLDSEQDAFTRVIMSETLKALVELRGNLNGEN